jgi:hypothetical protein
MEAIPFSPEIYIRDSDHGFLALGALVITQAVEDVRLYLTAPKLGERKTQHGRNDVKCREAARETEAHAAARWLQSQACRDLAQMLEDCGHPVPMKRFFLELQELKAANPERAEARTTNAEVMA